MAIEHKSIQRNPFWEVIKQYTPQFGFMYKIERGHTKHKVIIHGIYNGRPSTLTFPFDREVRSFHAVDNFTKAYVKFLRDYTAEIGFVSDNPNFKPPEKLRKVVLEKTFVPKQEVEPERKSTFVQKAYKEPEKKVLAAPTPLKVELANAVEKTPSFVDVMPYIPSTYVGDEKKKPVANEPLSTTKSLAVFMVSNAELSTLLELMDGLAVYRGSKPAPLRLTGEQQTSVPVQQLPSVNVKKPVLHVVQPEPAPSVIRQIRKMKPRESGMSQIRDRILNFHNKKGPTIWSAKDFYDIMDKHGSIQATLSLLVKSGAISKVGIDQFIAPTVKKQAKKAGGKK